MVIKNRVKRDKLIWIAIISLELIAYISLGDKSSVHLMNLFYKIMIAILSYVYAIYVIHTMSCNDYVLLYGSLPIRKKSIFTSELLSVLLLYFVEIGTYIVYIITYRPDCFRGSFIIDILVLLIHTTMMISFIFLLATAIKKIVPLLIVVVVIVLIIAGIKSIINETSKVYSSIEKADNITDLRDSVYLVKSNSNRELYTEIINPFVSTDAIINYTSNLGFGYSSNQSYGMDTTDKNMLLVIAFIDLCLSLVIIIIGRNNYYKCDLVCKKTMPSTTFNRFLTIGIFQMLLLFTELIIDLFGGCVIYINSLLGYHTFAGENSLWIFRLILVVIFIVVSGVFSLAMKNVFDGEGWEKW